DLAVPIVDDPTLWGELGDLNGDGKLDVVTGQGEGNPQLDRVYLGNDNAPVDERPPWIIVWQTIEVAAAGETPVVRFAVADNAVTDEGPRLQRAFARVMVMDAETEVDAFSMGGDLFRVELPAQAEGTEVSVTSCAVDRQQNEGCADPFVYAVEMGAGTGGDDVGTATDSDGGIDDASASGTTADDTGGGLGSGADGSA